MNKVLLIVSLLSVLLCVGCDKDEKINNDVNNNVPEVVIENQEQELINYTDGNDYNEYKLTDGYVIGQVDDKSIYNILRFGEYKPDYEFESDNTTFRIKIEQLSGEDGNTYNFTLNGKKLQINHIDENGEEKQIIVGENHGESIGVIDLDETDSYKELVIEERPGIDGRLYFYRVTKDDFILIDDLNLGWNDLCNINGKWIFTNYITSATVVSEGYWIYQNGKFEFVDRFINGEPVTNENGEYSKNYQSLIWKVPGEAGGISKSIDDFKTQLLAGTEYSFVAKRKIDTEYGETTVHDIKIINDTEWSTGEKISAGTILQNVDIWGNW